MLLNTEICQEQRFHKVYIINKVYMNILSLFMFFIAFHIVFAVQVISFEEIELHYTQTDMWKLLGSIFLLIIFHEALHAFAALLWGKVPRRSIHFGFKWQWFVFYCHCDKPLKVNTYRIFVLFPLIVTTPIAGSIFWLDPSIWSILFFSCTIASCAGDVLLFFKVRHIKNDKWIQDHPSKPGFYILPESITVSLEEHHHI